MMYRPENCIPLVLRHDDVDELLRGICTGVFLDLDVHLLLPLSWVGLPACLLEQEPMPGQTSAAKAHSNIMIMNE